MRFGSTARDRGVTDRSQARKYGVSEAALYNWKASTAAFARLLARSGWFYQALAVVPESRENDGARKRAIRDIDEAILGGFRAVNIEPGGASPTDDRRIYPIYACCEDRNLPVILMTGGNAGPNISYSSPEHLDRVLGDFPTLTIVSSHGNWPWVHQILHVAFRRPNLYLSPDYLLSNMPGMDDYVKAADSWLADRILYASAFPFAPI